MRLLVGLKKLANKQSPVAQLVERVTVNHQVGGSSPSRGATIAIIFFLDNQKIHQIILDDLVHTA